MIVTLLIGVDMAVNVRYHIFVLSTDIQNHHKIFGLCC